MDLRIVLVLALGLAGCAGIPTETVYLINKSGQRVTCGPYDLGSHVMMQRLAEENLRNCIEDFQRTGYERISTPQ